VLNQSVLLRGVNDAADTLVALSLRLLELRVLPYYLHQLDQVAGAAHFWVPVERGRELIAALRSQLPGYGVPRYVREEPGRDSKTLLA
jgi:L-lysine 2,3-aminomutase